MHRSWYFGKKLADDPKLQGIPIGLVGSFVGGTFIEQWVRNDTQAECQQTLCGTPTVHAPLCGSLFNGNIAPFINTTIAGIIWCKSSPPTAYYDVHSFHEGASLPETMALLYES